MVTLLCLCISFWRQKTVARTLYLVPGTLCDVFLYPSSSPSSHSTHSLVKVLMAVGVVYPHTQTLFYVANTCILTIHYYTVIFPAKSRNEYYIILYVFIAYIAVYFCMLLRTIIIMCM